MQQHITGTCQCGKVTLQGIGHPIISNSCYCRSCQTAGRLFEQWPGAPSVLNADGGTDYVLYRKDRVQCLAGEGYLKEHRLKPESPTRRIIATCCNSPMFLDATQTHWLTLYRQRLPADAPPPEMRIMTKDRRDGVVLADDLPNHDRFSGKAMLQLLAAWIAMGFRRPQIAWGRPRSKN